MVGCGEIGGQAVARTREGVALVEAGAELEPVHDEIVELAELLSRGDPMVFLQRPISATLLAVTAGIIVLALVSTGRNRRRARAASQTSQQEGTAQ